MDLTTTSAAEPPLLVVDGDAFAHRAYHALPKSTLSRLGRPAGALTGFTNMLLRLWEAEHPRAVFVGFDTIGAPTYRHEIFAPYQSGRDFDDEILEQLEILPSLVVAAGIAFGKQPGFEADDFLAASVRREEARGGRALVATSDRDAFQLASGLTTILQPIRGVSEMARIGPQEVRERYGVEPHQVPDFIALRGDPSDKLPGARGIGEKTAARLLAGGATLESLLAAGRFEREADALRVFKHIATLDSSAPISDIPDRRPDWGAAADRAEELGLDGLAARLRKPV